MDKFLKKLPIIASKVKSNLLDAVFFMRNREGDDDGTNGPSWKYRRKLIYGAYRLGFAMIIFGAITYSSDTAVGSGLVAGGVSLISIIVTAYTASATIEDVKVWQPSDQNHME
jgi:hypothetical protein